MTLWLIIIAILALTSVLLLLPLLSSKQADPTRVDYDIAVYRDQLHEIERDMQRGLIIPSQAEATRAEISRRMLAAEAYDNKHAEAQVSARGNRILAFFILFCMPLFSIALYSYLGTPWLTGKPYAQRLHDPDFIMAADAEKLSKLLKNRPDATGYQYLADMYYLLHRYQDAADAYQQIITMGLGTSKTWSALGEMITLSQNGMVILDARSDFLKAYSLDAHDVRSCFYLGVWEMQNNAPRAAVAIWKDLQNKSLANAEVMGVVRQHITLVSEKFGFKPESVMAQPPSAFFKP